MLIARFTTGEDPRYAIVEGGQGNGFLHVISGDPLYQTVQMTGEKVRFDDAVRLLAPVIPRSKVVAVGKNYADHVAEMAATPGEAPPEEPLLFFKPNTSVIGPGDPIVLPRQSTNVHYEGELAIVIGKLCKEVPVERVNEVILGYTIANDVTARDLQKSDKQWARAKGFDTFCPIGPYLVLDTDATDLRLTTRVNGEVKQDGSTSQLIHKIPEIVAYVSAAFTLLPGDIILTGTPAGVGPIVAGDRVEIEIEGMGVLSNPVVSRD
ncbi:fumarylacetoacetate hydrolase family protein [Kineosporia mesophila]|uniref:Fumarylacetoacetate hydrolase family protein n=1 Tax=Kineosporia mesophila TaxID=566012 RepID=A0ABP6Z3J9_9ACTN|nr:fumarylacetoacetate hydrolase family protein [Kineosporia mesophila]